MGLRARNFTARMAAWSEAIGRMPCEGEDTEEWRRRFRFSRYEVVALRDLPYMTCLARDCPCADGLGRFMVHTSEVSLVLVGRDIDVFWAGDCDFCGAEYRTRIVHHTICWSCLTNPPPGGQVSGGHMPSAADFHEVHPAPGERGGPPRGGRAHRRPRSQP